MLHHVFSVFCESVSIQDGHVHINNVIDGMDVNYDRRPPEVKKPPDLLNLAVHAVSQLFNVGRTEEVASYSWAFNLPNGWTVSVPEWKLEVRVPSGKHHRVQVQELRVPYGGEGLYWLEILLTQAKQLRTVARLPFYIALKRMPPGGRA